MDIAKAVKIARHDLELEGFVFTEEELVIDEKIAKGEMTPEEALALMDSKIARLKVEHPEYFSGA